MSFGSFSWQVDLTLFSAQLEAELADYFAKENSSRPNDFTPTNPSVINTVNVAIAPPIPTADNLQPTIEYAQAVVAESVAEFGVQETPLVVTLLETLDDAGDLAGYLTRPVPAFWFGNIQVMMNGLTDAQRTIVGNLDIGSQLSVTKSFPNSTPSTVTQIMALEGISHDITPDRHIVTLYPNPTRIYTYFILGGYTTTTTRTNLLPNPNMDNSSVGTYYQAVSITETRSTDYAYSGTYSLKGVIDTATTQYFQVLQTAGAMIDVTAGQTYTFSAYIYLPASNTADSTWRAELYFWNGTSYTGANAGTTVTVTRGNWTRLTTTATVPAGYYKALPRILKPSPALAIGQVAYVDAWLLENTSSLLPYFDGTYADTYTGYTLTSQGWNGTADGSTSTATWGLTSSFVGSELNDDTKGLA